MLTTGKDHWEPLLRARAIENQVFVVAADQIGPLPGTRMLRYGRSMIIDPWGTVLAQAADTETVITAELDFDYLSSVRKRVPSLIHRRTAVYGIDI
jgi:predicted amidohydrolase